MYILFFRDEGAAAAAAFFVDIDRGKLLQYKLIHVQCIIKKVPKYGSPLYPSTGIRFKKVIFEQPIHFCKIFCHGRLPDLSMTGKVFPISGDLF